MSQPGSRSGRLPRGAVERSRGRRASRQARARRWNQARSAPVRTFRAVSRAKTHQKYSRRGVRSPGGPWWVSAAAARGGPTGRPCLNERDFGLIGGHLPLENERRTSVRTGPVEGPHSKDSLRFDTVVSASYSHVGAVAAYGFGRFGHGDRPALDAPIATAFPCQN